LEAIRSINIKTLHSFNNYYFVINYQLMNLLTSKNTTLLLTQKTKHENFLYIH